MYETLLNGYKEKFFYSDLLDNFYQTLLKYEIDKEALETQKKECINKFKLKSGFDFKSGLKLKSEIDPSALEEHKTLLPKLYDFSKKIINIDRAIHEMQDNIFNDIDIIHSTIKVNEDSFTDTIIKSYSTEPDLVQQVYEDKVGLYNDVLKRIRHFFEDDSYKEKKYDVWICLHP